MVCDTTKLSLNSYVTQQVHWQLSTGWLVYQRGNSISLEVRISIDQAGVIRRVPDRKVDGISMVTSEGKVRERRLKMVCRTDGMRISGLSAVGREKQIR